MTHPKKLLRAGRGWVPEWCRYCDGDGIVEASNSAPGAEQSMSCPLCCGTGKRVPDETILRLRVAAADLIAEEAHHAETQATVRRLEAELHHANTFAPPNVFGAHTLAALIEAAAECKADVQRLEADRDAARADTERYAFLKRFLAVEQDDDCMGQYLCFDDAMMSDTIWAEGFDNTVDSLIDVARFQPNHIDAALPVSENSDA